MELNEFLNNISKSGNYWIDYHVIMGKVRKYDKKYGILIMVK